MTTPPICDYCRFPAKLVTGEKVYPHRKDLHHKKFWYCDNSHPPAYVGVHEAGKDQGDGTKPLGRLADKVLRKAKRNAHQAFDYLWQDRIMSRKEAYAWLAKELGIKPERCHIGMMDVQTCNAVVDVCLLKLAEVQYAKG